MQNPYFLRFSLSSCIHKNNEYTNLMKMCLCVCVYTMMALCRQEVHSLKHEMVMPRKYCASISDMTTSLASH